MSGIALTDGHHHATSDHSSSSEVWRLVRLVATYGLPCAAPTHPPTASPLDETAFRSLLRAVERQRLTGHLMDMMTAGDLPTTASQAEQVADRHLAWCVSMLDLERELLRVVAILEEAGIDVAVLKGAAAAHLYYPDPALRLFGDNDILVRSGQVEHALRILMDAGYVRRGAATRPDFDRRFGKGATLYGEAGMELDLHRSLVFGGFGLAIDLDGLWASTTTFTLGGRTLRVLDPDSALLHAMFHAALGDAVPQLGVLRDLAQRLASDRHDPNEVIAIARRWRAMPVLKRAVLLVDEVLGVAVQGPIAEAAATYRPTRSESRALASYIAEDRSFAAMVWSSLPYLRSNRERLAFLRAVARSFRRSAEQRGVRGAFALWRRGARAVLGGSRR